MASNVWGVAPGTAWAEQVEQEEAQNGGSLALPADAFPSLGEAVKTKPQKKKAQKVSLTEFNKMIGGGRAVASDKDLLMSLPTAPRGDRGGADDGELGGGFGQYGGRRGGRDDRDGERGGGRFDEPSRADQDGDWGATRKFAPSSGEERRGYSFGSGGARDRDGGGRESGPSAADEAESWGGAKKFVPSADEGGDRRGGGFGGGGFRDRNGYDSDRRGPGGGGPDREDRFVASRADEGDWGRRAAPAAPASPVGPGGDRDGRRDNRSYGFSGGDTRGMQEDRWARGTAAAAGSSRDASAPGSPTSAAGGAPSERPRLKLAPRTKPLPEPIAAASAPSSVSAENSRGEGADSASATGSGTATPSEATTADRPKKSNPFGAARPREEILKEKGIDWKKEELKLEHGDVIRDKSAEESSLEAEIEKLRTKLEALKEAEPEETDEMHGLEVEVDEKEKALYKLAAELDDKVRFSKPAREPVEERSRPTAAAAPGGPRDGGEPRRPTSREPGGDRRGPRSGPPRGAGDIDGRGPPPPRGGDEGRVASRW